MGSDEVMESLAQRVRLSVPESSSCKKGINNEPEAMWEILQKEDNVLGVINPRNPVPWYCIFPTSQYVPEEAAENMAPSHFMVAPRISRFATPENLSAPEILPVASFINKFLEKNRSLVGYNIGSDPHSILRNPQSWKNWHIHHVILPDEVLEKVHFRPKVLLEPGYQHIGHILGTAFDQHISELSYLNLGRRVEEDTLRKYGFSPRGSLVFEFEKLDPWQLANILKDLDALYSELHREFFGIFFANYDQVRASGWREDYACSDTEEVRLKIYNNVHNEGQREFLIRLNANVLPRLAENRRLRRGKMLYQAPTYSVAFLKRDEKLYLVFHPHFLRKGGALESLGIQLIRELKEGSSLSRRRSAAQTMVDEILGKVRVGVAA